MIELFASKTKAIFGKASSLYYIVSCNRIWYGFCKRVTGTGTRNGWLGRVASVIVDKALCTVYRIQGCLIYWNSEIATKILCYVEHKLC